MTMWSETHNESNPARSSVAAIAGMPISKGSGPLLGSLAPIRIRSHCGRSPDVRASYRSSRPRGELMSAMLGVDHIGVGVSDMERSKAFWAEVGFSDVAFDYQGPLAGPTGTTHAHVVWLRPGNPTVLGSAPVNLGAPAHPPPRPAGMAGGE